MSASAADADREMDRCCPDLPTEILDSHGIPLLVRLVEPSDEAAIRDLHERCSERALRWAERRLLWGGYGGAKS